MYSLMHLSRRGPPYYKIKAEKLKKNFTLNICGEITGDGCSATPVSGEKTSVCMHEEGKKDAIIGTVSKQLKMEDGLISLTTK